MSTPIVELTHRAFEAMNRRDLDWLVAHCDPDARCTCEGSAGEPVLYMGAPESATTSATSRRSG